jgi:hypothetical protein
MSQVKQYTNTKERKPPENIRYMRNRTKVGVEFIIIRKKKG